MDLHNLTPEERRLCNRMEDMARRCERSYASQYTGFLDEKQAELARLALARAGWEHYWLWGGYPGAGRVMLCVHPPYGEAPEADFPLKGLTLIYRSEDGLSHRDILGALMGLQVKREAVGDILVEETEAALFVTPPVAALALSELSKVGRAGVKIREGLPDALPQGERFMEISGTVSSMRLDCILALAARLSREKAAALIKSGLVSLEFSPCGDLSRQVRQGDRLSVRGHGRFVVSSVEGPTKKGRIRVTVLKNI